MFAALDKDGNKIFADAEHTYTGCKCIACGGDVILKNKGKIRVPHFAHAVDSNCSYGQDKDNKSEWHRHMQELFPPDTLEVRFEDNETGDIHIADVFIEEANTVIEFQHSPISVDEFVSRTKFHILNGRRIVWVFDESKEGRLKLDDLWGRDIWHKDLNYNWPRSPRKVMEFICKDSRLDVFNNYSVCVYTGNEGDIVHRIINQEIGYKYITLSVHNIELGKDMNLDEFFYTEDYWMAQSPWKEKIEDYNRMRAQSRPPRQVYGIRVRQRPRRRGWL